MATYTIIGGDQKQYGSVTADDIRRWIADGRLNAQSLVRGENDTEWRALAEFPEFADALAAQITAAGAAAAAAVAFQAAELDGDYELDIGSCVSRGFELLKSNFGVVFVATLLFAIIEGFIAGLGAIPFIGPVFSLVNLVIAGPLLGGLFYVFIQTIRRQPANAGDVFMGFRRQFVQLFLGKIVTSLLAGLCMIPFVVVMIIMVARMAVGHHEGSSAPEARVQELMALFGHGAVLLVFFVCLIPTIYLQVRWLFTLPLIIDRQMDFWTAMKVSWRMVGKHWWQVFGLVVLIGLLNIVGLIACCVGVLFTAPIGYGALMYAYETIFSAAGAKTG